MEARKATKVGELRRFFSPRPIAIRNLEEYYVHTAKVRGGTNVIPKLEMILRQSLEEVEVEDSGEEWEDVSRKSHYQIIFAGYRGCGKSTELNRLQKELDDDFLVLKFSVQKKLDPQNLHYVGLFITTMECLFELIEQHDLYSLISKDYLDAVLSWSQTKDVVELRERHFTVETEAGAGLEAGLKWIGGFFAKFRSAVKSSKSMKETISSNIEPRLSDLLELCNNLIREVERNLGHFGKRGLLIIIEDLDKIPLDVATRLFKFHANQLTALKTNVLFTFPIALINNPDFRSISSYFDLCEPLPMVKVNNRDGSINFEGRKSLKEMVARRMDLSLFESEEYLDRMIAISGGCIRDLFLMILDAGETAAIDEKDKIGKDEWISAYQKLKNEYSHLLADKLVPREDGYQEVAISVARYKAALIKLADAPPEEKVVDNLEEELDLRQNLAILSYNGVEWCDVHPVMKDILKDRGLLKTSQLDQR